MLYKQRHLEPKCLELLPTQTTHDLVHDEQIPGCLTKVLKFKGSSDSKFSIQTWLRDHMSSESLA